MGACAQDYSGFIPSAASAIQRRLVGRNSALHGCWSGTCHNPRVEAEDKKSHGGTAQPIKMLQMKEPSGMCMKTQGCKTIWPIINRAFRPKMHSFCENGRQFVGLLGRKCTGKAVIGTKRGPKRAHRFIGSSIHRLRAESLLDGRISRWSDGPTASPFHYVLANKMG
jgi:hypothetical protein